MDEKEKYALYMISYFLYSGTQMPYKLYHTRNTEIDSKNEKDSIKFELYPINKKYGAPQFSSITYSLYITKSSEKLNEMLSCNFGKLFTMTQVVTS